MQKLECTSTQACAQYCDALKEQGVEVGLGPDGCTAPELFEIDGSEVRFNPGADIQNPSLVNKLGEALCGELSREFQNKIEHERTDKVITLYDSRFAAQQDLWGAMFNATRAGRHFTDAERVFYETAIAHVDESVKEVNADTPAETLLRAQAAFDRHTMEAHGLLFDAQITGVVDKLAGNLMDGKPALIVGDKGIAKTQAAKFVARLWDGGREPIIISGHGDQMADEFMGKDIQDPETGMFRFKEGKLVQAMREGRPVIMDEVNISDQAIAMRLNDILLRRPGDKIVLQENGGEEIEIKPGFAVFATANEASGRYQHRSQLDPAFRDRFDIVQVGYPDADTEPLTGFPHSLMRLAFASAADLRGEPSAHTPLPQLESLAYLAHATQHLYTVPSKDVRVTSLRPDRSTSEFLGGEEPLMSDCITPRALVETIKRCSDGNKPGMTLESEMERLIVSLDQAGSTANQDYARTIKTLVA